mgnify:CR=1 FL=1
MSGVNEKEIKTQERILHKIFEKKLGYTYLGNYEDDFLGTLYVVEVIN